MKKFVFFTILIVLFQVQANAQGPIDQYVKVIVAPDHEDWTYRSGEHAKFSISVIKAGNLLKDVTVVYEVGPEKMEPTKRDSLKLAKGTLTVDGGTLKNPGFLRCTVTAYVDSIAYKRLATAGFEPLKIEPTVAFPEDFDAFWKKAKEDLAKIPLDTRMTLLPERCTENSNVYQVSVQNFPAAARVYGILTVPKKPGKYPAILEVPGAGVRPYQGLIALGDKGIITLQIGIHGVPVNLDPSVYTNLGDGALNGYWNINLDDKDRIYYKRVYLGCVRSVDLLFSLPQFDGSSIAVTGGSQGGALSIVTASLDSRIKFLGAYYPALCDVTGYLHGRAGGWPHYFDKKNIDFNNKKDKIATCGYYDVVNFAKGLKVPGMYSWGFNDETCPPTSMYAAYNSIKSPKTLFLALETGHYTFVEQRDKMESWLLQQLGVKKNQ